MRSLRCFASNIWKLSLNDLSAVWKFSWPEVREVSPLKLVPLLECNDIPTKNCAVCSGCFVGDLRRDPHGPLSERSQAEVEASWLPQCSVEIARERADLPCLFEGIVSISDIDASTKAEGTDTCRSNCLIAQGASPQVELVLRFPKVHACDFTPRRGHARSKRSRAVPLTTYSRLHPPSPQSFGWPARRRVAEWIVSRAQDRVHESF